MRATFFLQLMLLMLARRRNGVAAEPQIGMAKTSRSPPRMAFAPPSIPSLDLPVGAEYYRQLKFPVLGLQAFRIHILSETRARLQITGMLGIDEIIPYSTDLTGRLYFSLSEKTKQILKRFKTKLLEAGYDPHTDTPYVKVAPYVLPAVKISMNRLPEEEPSSD